MITFPGSQILYSAGSVCARKLNKAQTKRANILGVQYFHELSCFAPINRNVINFVLSFILSSFYFLTIFSNFPFLLPLRLCPLQSTLPPLLIVVFDVVFPSLHPSAAAVAQVRGTCIGSSLLCHGSRHFWRRQKLCFLCQEF